MMPGSPRRAARAVDSRRRAPGTRRALAGGAGVLLAAAAALGQPGKESPAEEDPPPARIDARGTYLRPNTRDVDGTPAYVHVTPADMPLRVAVPRPRVPARDGSTRRAREAAIEAMRLWEQALRPELPWFALAFVERDPEAAVQVEWTRGRRAGGSALGRGWILWRTEGDGTLRVGGGMRISMQPYLPFEQAITLDELRLLVAHEFGHVLGLGHCLACDSAMNYAWDTREGILVTPLDVATFLALVAKPNGMRVDGGFLEGVRPDAATAAKPPRGVPEEPVTAD